MKKILEALGICAVVLSISAQASLPEYFAASAKTASLGGQGSGLSSDAVNNYYMPALLAFSKKTSFSFNAFAINTSLKPIENIVVRNSVNSSTSNLIGNTDTDYGIKTLAGVHLALPLFAQLNSKLGISAFLPITELIGASTGDPYEPEYVMYRSRYNRPQIFINNAFRFGKTSAWAASVGLQIGFATSAETFALTRINGDPNPSSAKATVKAKPAFALLASLSHKLAKGYASFSFQQELKSNFAADIVGLAPLGGSSSVAFALDAKSMIAYDPAILRFQLTHSFKNLKLLGTLEYQLWTGYETPVLQIAQDRSSIINPSAQVEQLETQNIFVPRIGIEWRASSKMILRAGYFYRPSPLVKDHNLSGNTLDADVHSINFGGGYLVKLMGVPIELTAGFQLHLLASETVDKIAIQENGAPGSPIGYGGYEIGGTVQVLSLGAKWSF